MGERQVVREGREPDLVASGVAVRIVEQRAGGRVVDDPVAGIVGMGAPKERAACQLAGGTEAHRLTSLTCAIALIVAISSRLSRSNRGVPGPEGFASTASAPALSACIEFRTSFGSRLETITTGVADSIMIRRVASTPSITGIWMSMVTRSGFNFLHCSIASTPSRA